MTYFAGDPLAAADLNAIVNRPRFTGTLGSPSLTSGSVTTITPASALHNVGSMWSSGTNIVIPTGQGGEYDLGIVARFASQTTAAGFRQARVSINGTEWMQWNTPAPTNLNATNVTAGGVIPADLNAGDVITFAVFQNSGGALGIVGNSTCWVVKRVQ